VIVIVSTHNDSKTSQVDIEYWFMHFYCFQVSGRTAGCRLKRWHAMLISRRWSLI